MEFSRQEYWSGFPFPPPGDLPNPGIKPWSPALQADALLSEPQGLCIVYLYPWSEIFKEQISLEHEEVVRKQKLTIKGMQGLVSGLVPAIGISPLIPTLFLVFFFLILLWHHSLRSVCCCAGHNINIFSLCLVFVSLISMCLGLFLLEFILYGTLCASWILLTISFSMLGKFSTIIFSKIFSYPFFSLLLGPL